MEQEFWERFKTWLLPEFHKTSQVLFLSSSAYEYELAPGYKPCTQVCSCNAFLTVSEQTSSSQSKSVKGKVVRTENHTLQQELRSLAGSGKLFCQGHHFQAIPTYQFTNKPAMDLLPLAALAGPRQISQTLRDLQGLWPGVPHPAILPCFSLYPFQFPRVHIRMNHHHLSPYHLPFFPSIHIHSTVSVFKSASPGYRHNCGTKALSDLCTGHTW